jgi:hypothetical protein
MQQLLIAAHKDAAAAFRLLLGAAAGLLIGL